MNVKTKQITPATGLTAAQQAVFRDTGLLLSHAAAVYHLRGQTSIGRAALAEIFSTLTGPETLEQPVQASAQTGRAGQARHDDLALIASVQSASAEPAAWHHIGKHMRADAPPVNLRPRWVGRSSPKRNRLIRIRVVIAVAVVSAAVLVLNGVAKGVQL